MRTWSAEEEEWLRENYHEGTINDTLARFEEEFGYHHSKQATFVKANKMGLKKDRHAKERKVPAKNIMRWSSPRFAEHKAWMLEHDRGESVFRTIDEFEKEFGIRLNRSQVSLFRSTYGTCKRISHGGGKPALPVGTERPWKDGYIKVKVKMYPDVPQTKDNWRFKHYIVWEEANGRPVPEGCTVVFADKDRRNFDPDNLVAIPRKYVGQLNNDHLPSYHDRDTLLACIALCDLRSGLLDAQASVPRKCKVCGEEFVPDPKTREYRTPVATCPECIAAGHKYAGERNAGQGACAICGREFTKKNKRQRRCPECIATRPRWAVEAHKRNEEKEARSCRATAKSTTGR